MEPNTAKKAKRILENLAFLHHFIKSGIRDTVGLHKSDNGEAYAFNFRSNGSSLESMLAEAAIEAIHKKAEDKIKELAEELENL